MTIDRSFASEPPACVGEFGEFQFEPGPWVQLTIDAAKDIKARAECLILTEAWIEGERRSRAEAEELIDE